MCSITLTRKYIATPASIETPTTDAAAIPMIPVVLIPFEGAAEAVADALAEVPVTLFAGATERNVVVMNVDCAVDGVDVGVA